MEIKTTQDNYIDYFGQHFFNLLGTADVRFTFKQVTVGEAIVPLLHIEGMNLNDASAINIDFWPYRNATKSDLAKLPKSISDFKFRVGFATTLELNTETGEQKKVTHASNPKLLGYYDKDHNFVEFSGKKHIHIEGGAPNEYEPWENEDDLPKEEAKPEEKPAEQPAETAEAPANA